MKRYLFIIIQLCISSITLFSQDLEPAQVRFLYGQDSIYLSTDDTRFQEQRFMLGWHWGNGPTLSRVLRINQVHEATLVPEFEGGPLIDVPDSMFADSVDVIMNTPVVGHHWEKFSPVLGISIQWEPALLIDNPPKFKTIEGDTTRPIFGFRTIRGGINESRLYLNSTIPNNTMVLSDNWPDSEFYYPSKLSSTPDGNSYGLNALPNPSIQVFNRDFNGTDLYFTVNLKRDGADTVRNADNVLKIQLKYFTIGGDSGYVRFKNLPYLHKDSISILPKNRGKVRKIDATHNATTEFNITKSMLPIQSDSGRMDITISAKMIFDSSITSPNYHNLRFWSASYDTISMHIKRLKMEITYVDNSLPISIDWVRIESKVAQDLFRGYYDSAIVENARLAIAHLTTPAFQNRGIRPYRFYLQDEHLPAHWGTHRYINKLIGNIGTVEARFWDVKIANAFPLQRMYYLDLHEFWGGANTFNGGLADVPYVRFGHNSNDYFRNLASFGINGGYSRGYTGEGDRSYTVYDSLHSDYEINLWDIYDANGNWLRPRTFNDVNSMTKEEYEQWIYSINHIQEVMERAIYDLMLSPNYQKFIFSGQNWFYQNWIGNDLGSIFIPDTNFYIINYINGSDTIRSLIDLQDTIGNVNNIILNGSHSSTGEELSLFVWQPLILGAKGLIYDLETSIEHYPYNPTGSRIGIWNGQRFFDNTDPRVPVAHRLTQAQRDYLLSGDMALLYSDSVGGDYITIPTASNDVPPNVYVWDYTQTQDYLPKFITMKYILGLNNNLLYLGRKSVRTSLYKIHKWVRANEETLMKLRLQSWLGKGYRRWYAQADEIQADTLLKEYILIDSIKTRPIGREDTLGNPYFEQGAEIDSGFYDITLLRDFEAAGDTGIYLGVQNRRTDPLIYDADGDTMKFTPTAEFDQHVLSTVPEEAHYWQSLWWRRQGAREIRIPINPSFNGYNAQAVRVRELNNLIDWFANEPYNNVIDTMLKVEGGEGYIIMKLLPGQGKILRVDPVPFEESFNLCPPCDLIFLDSSLVIEHKDKEACYTMNLKILPCQYVDMNELEIEFQDLPPCFQKSFSLRLYQNDIVVQEIPNVSFNGVMDLILLDLPYPTSDTVPIDFRYEFCLDSAEMADCLESDFTSTTAIVKVIYPEGKNCVDTFSISLRNECQPCDSIIINEDLTIHHLDGEPCYTLDIEYNPCSYDSLADNNLRIIFNNLPDCFKKLFNASVSIEEPPQIINFPIDFINFQPNDAITLPVPPGPGNKNLHYVFCPDQYPECSDEDFDGVKANFIIAGDTCEQLPVKMKNDCLPCDSIIPQDKLIFKPDTIGKCYTMEIKVLPCPYMNIDALYLFFNNIPPCFQKLYTISYYQGDSLIPINGQNFDFTGLDSNLIILPIPIAFSDTLDTLSLKYKLCLVNPETDLCTESDSIDFTVTAFFSGDSCRRVMRIGFESGGIIVPGVFEDYPKFFDKKYNNFKIIPNPSQDKIKVIFKEPIPQSSKVSILDYNGRKILDVEAKGFQIPYQLEIDVSQIPSGSYLFAVYNNSTLIKGKKFVILR